MAEQTGNCEVRPQCMAREIIVRPNGRVDGCIYIDKFGRENKLRAKIVAVCCSAMESARLLLLSSSRLYPNGLANSSGLVGRHLQLHGYSAGSGFLPDIPQTEKQRRYALGRSVMDYYLLPPSVTDLPKGGILRFDLANRHPIRASQRLAQEPSGRLLWGKRLKQKLNQNFRETLEVEFEVFHDFLPNPNSYIDLDPHVKDRWGLPVARIHLADTPHQQKAGGWLVDRGLEILKTMGAEQVTATAIGKTTPFLVHGTCRAGKKPRESVLNEFCQAHDAPNLWVVDGSFMPTSGGAPSTLTIMANSFRAADAILAGANRGDFN
jgi:choline dehydrogenase-like flavoprotein